MTHNDISRIFRTELANRVVKLNDWDRIIYEFASQYNIDKSSDIISCINACIDNNLKGEKIEMPTLQKTLQRSRQG